MGTVSNFTFEHHVDQNMVFGCLKFKRKTNNGELLGKHLDRSKKTQIACRLLLSATGKLFFIICGDVDEFEIRNIYHSD